MKRTDVTKLVERLEAFEERTGVRLDAISSYSELDTDDHTLSITVLGELHAVSGAELEEDVLLNMVVYDATGRVIGTESAYFSSDDFFGFETFEIRVFELQNTAISRIRIIPKKSS